MNASDVAREIADLWATGTPVVYLVTVEERRALALCRAAAGGKAAQVAVWSAHRGLDPTAPAARDPIAALEALAAQTAPVVAVLLDFHEAMENPRVARCLRDLSPTLVERGHRLAIVAPRAVVPEGLASEVAVVTLPLPDEAALGAALDQVAAGKTIDGAARHRALLAARGLTVAQAGRAFRRGLRHDATLAGAAIEAILAEKKRILSADLGLELIEAVERADDLGGLSTFKAWMRERALAFAPEASRYGLQAPRGVMLLGVQGCGKSLSAKVVATELAVPLVRLNIPRVLGAGSGGVSAEESLERALRAVEAISPVALWIDEIEKGFAGSGDGGDSRAARLLGAFSTWLQERESSVFVVATANDVTRLPPELLRRGRFDELFFVDLPDFDERCSILAVHLRRRNRDAARFDLPALARQCDGFSGAELEQVVVGALHRGFSLSRDLDEADLRRVAQDLVPLYKTYEEQIKSLREWARGRARPAGRENAIVDLFRRVEG